MHVTEGLHRALELKADAPAIRHGGHCVSFRRCPSSSTRSTIPSRCCCWSMTPSCRWSRRCVGRSLRCVP